MSVTTTAEEHKEKAKENVNDAITNIAAIVIDEVWGAESYSSEYLAMLTIILSDLLKIRELMK